MTIPAGLASHLAIGLGLASGIVLATLPLVGRLTDVAATRYE